MEKRNITLTNPDTDKKGMTEFQRETEFDTWQGYCPFCKDGILTLNEPLKFIGCDTCNFFFKGNVFDGSNKKEMKDKTMEANATGSFFESVTVENHNDRVIAEKIQASINTATNSKPEITETQPFKNHWRNYYGIGLFPYPMEKDRKKPRVNLKYEDTSEWIDYDQKDLEKWEKKFPDSNIMVRLNGVVCLDPDGEQAEAFVKSLNLPQCPTSISSKRSVHRYFKTNIPFETFKIKFGKDDVLEVRAGDSLMVVPPSIHPETRKPYQWQDGCDPWTMGGFEELPADILSRLQKMSIPKTVKPLSDSDEGKFGRIDIEKYFSDFGIEIAGRKQRGSFTIFKLKNCLWSDEHGHGDFVGDSAFFQGPEGELGFSCFHNACEGRGWKEAREKISGGKPLYVYGEKYDPNYKSQQEIDIESLTDESYIKNQKEIFLKLSRLPEGERELKIKAISIRNDLNKFISKDKENMSVKELLETCEEGCKVYTAQNYQDGILSYGVRFGDTKLVIESTGSIIQPSKEVILKFGRSRLTKDAVKRFMDGEDVGGKELFERLSRLFSDHVYFDDWRLPGLLALWVIGTYFYKAFPYYGYLYLTSIVKRCAKSLVEDLLSCVCHNATTRYINPSEASVFRQVDGDDVTLIIDEVETLRSKEKPEMVGLINGGFQKGSMVSRMEARGKEWVSVSYNTYSPKVLAGIKGVSDTVEDRSFKIVMVRKSLKEKFKRFNVRLQEYEFQMLRDDLYIFALNHGPDIIELYDGVTGGIPEMEEFDDRQKDILEPLACIAMGIDELADDKERTLFNGLIDLARTMSKKRASHEKLDGGVPAMLEVLERELDNNENVFILASKFFEKVNQTDGLSFKSKKSLGSYLSKMGIDSEQRRVGVDGKNEKGYFVTKEWLEDMKKRYGS